MNELFCISIRYYSRNFSWTKSIDGTAADALTALTAGREKKFTKKRRKDIRKDGRKNLETGVFQKNGSTQDKEQKLKRGESFIKLKGRNNG